MRDKPSQALRKARNTTMWNSLTSVSNGEAEVAISCGNTGALMAMSMMKLKKINGINRPAIAVLWPSTNSRGFNILLDAGADIRADAQDLCQYALMGVSYAKSGFNIKNPKVGILNIGTEEHKGSTELLKAADIINNLSSILGFKFIGYVEGDDIPSSKIDVIVTDGFTGNIALKTGEGTATLVRTLFKETFNNSLMAKIASFIFLYRVTGIYHIYFRTRNTITQKSCNKRLRHIASTKKNELFFISHYILNLGRITK